MNRKFSAAVPLPVPEDISTTVLRWTSGARDDRWALRVSHVLSTHPLHGQRSRWIVWPRHSSGMREVAGYVFATADGAYGWAAAAAAVTLGLPAR